MATVDELIPQVEAGEANAVTELITLGEQGTDLRPALPALTAALVSPNVALNKEAVWAIYVVAWQGHPLGDARAPLEQAAASDTHRGNASLGLVVDDLKAGKIEPTLARMDDRDENAHVQFAIAHGLTDFCERTKDRKLFERVLRKLPFGIVAPMLSNGVAGSILTQVARGPSFTGQVLSEVANAETDDLKAAPLFGVLMKIRERMR
jgi:hypothetical protein